MTLNANVWPRFIAKATTTTFDVAGTPVKVPFNSAELDINSDFDTTNNRWLPTVSGRYFLVAHVELRNSDQTETTYASDVNFKIEIYEDGVTMHNIDFTNFHVSTALPIPALIQTTIETDGSKYYEIFVSQTGAGVTTKRLDSTLNYFAGVRVS
jgi:hypothetical protein